MSHKNTEGYADPTAGAAMSLVMKEYRQKQKQRFLDRHRKKVYVASKYAGDVSANTKEALKHCRYVIAEGCMPIASHILYAASGILKDDDPEERELGLMFGLALLGLCDEIWVFGDISPGMAAEIEEAKRRGLANNISTVDALPAYITEKNIHLFTDHAIYTRDEVYARYTIHVENYTATICMEARTLIDMLRKEILPSVSKYGTALCRGLERRKALGLPAKYEETNALNNCMLSDCLNDACDKLEKDLRIVPTDAEEAMRYCHTVIVPDMNECRSFADELETITSRDAWPIPVYSDLLFSEI